MDKKSLLTLNQHYWDFFKMQSDQRIKLIEFFISIEIVLIGGFFTLDSLETPIRWASFVDATAISIIALVFYGLDKRTRFLIRQVVDSISEVETLVLDDKECSNIALLPKIKKRSTKKFNIPYKWWMYLLYFLIGSFGVVLDALMVVKVI